MRWEIKFWTKATITIIVIIAAIIHLAVIIADIIVDKMS